MASDQPHVLRGLFVSVVDSSFPERPEILAGFTIHQDNQLEEFVQVGLPGLGSGCRGMSIFGVHDDADSFLLTIEDVTPTP